MIFTEVGGFQPYSTTQDLRDLEHVSIISHIFACLVSQSADDNNKPSPHLRCSTNWDVYNSSKGLCKCQLICFCFFFFTKVLFPFSYLYLFHPLLYYHIEPKIGVLFELLGNQEAQNLHLLSLLSKQSSDFGSISTPWCVLSPRNLARHSRPVTPLRWLLNFVDCKWKLTQFCQRSHATIP